MLLVPLARSLRDHTLLAAVALAALAPGASALQDWNQHRGNAAKTSATAQAPIEAAPAVAWSQDFEQLLSEPVVWAEVVYVVGLREGRKTLFAFRATTGEPLGNERLSRDASRAELAVWQGTVAVLTEGRLRFYRHVQDRFQRRRQLDCPRGGPATVHRGLLLAGGLCLDIARERELGELPGTGFAAVVERGDATLVSSVELTGRPDYQGTWVALLSAQLEGSGSGAELGSFERRFGAPLADHGTTLAAADRLGPVAFGTDWFVCAPGGYTAEGSPPGLVLEGGTVNPVAHPAAIHATGVLGLDADGRVVRVLASGGYESPAEAPAGGVPGPASIAQDVAYFTNWALHVPSRRVLWCLPEIDGGTTLIPLADGRALASTASQTLVCLAAPAVAEEHLTSAVDAGAGAPAPARPTDGDCHVLASGELVRGPVPADLEGVALIVSGDEARLVGEEFPVERAWVRALDRLWVEEDLALFEVYLSAGFVSDCRRLLEQAAAHGLESAEREQLARRLVGRTENTRANAPAQRARVGRDEAAARGRLLAEVLAAADWCREQGLLTAAGALLAYGAELSTPAALAERALTCVPPEFPWRGDGDAGARWMQWAPEILPAGGRFLDPDQSPVAVPDDGWALGTRNLVLVTGSSDPLVVGRCLRNGEGTVRALDQLLGARARPGVEHPPMTVRLHRTREEYLEEQRADGSLALPWSAGYYSPGEHLSRFYVPAEHRGRDALGRDLFETLAHELTHHYVDSRWVERSSRSASTPGYWVVEGIARFVEDQVVEMGRLGSGLGDDTVRSVEASAQAAAAGRLLAMERFLTLDNATFLELADEPLLDVRLRSTLVALQLSERTLFYEQAGAFVFFMLHRRDEAGREALLDLLRAHYAGRNDRQPWRSLGFEDAGACQQAFEAFLETTRG